MNAGTCLTVWVSVGCCIASVHDFLSLGAVKMCGKEELLVTLPVFLGQPASGTVPAFQGETSMPRLSLVALRRCASALCLKHP